MSQLPAKNGKNIFTTFEGEINRDPQLNSYHTKRGYKSDLTAFELWRDGRPLTKLLVEEYATELQKADHSPNSINRSLSAIRWWARRLGDLAFEPESNLTPERRQEIVTQTARVASIKGVRGERLQKGRHIAAGELEALIRVCQADKKASGVRDASVIGIAWMTGLRRSELVGLQLADLTVLERENDAGNELLSSIIIEASFTVRGKGNKERQVYLYGGAAAALSDWLRMRGRDTGNIFCPVLKSGRIKPKESMSTTALAKMLKKRTLQASLSKPITWHDFRRSFAGNLLDAGHDLVTVQKLMGHLSPTTTSNYDRRGEEGKRQAIRSLYVPY